MIQDTVSRVEAAIKRLGTKDKKTRSELIALLGKLKEEIAILEEAHGEHAASIVGFAEAAAHEATRRERSPELLRLSSAGLSWSVKGFETSHPRLVEAADNICRFLSALGI